MKLISLNIEQDKHLDRIMPFLAEQAPDVLCLQELFEKDVPLFESGLGMHSAYVPLALWKTEAGSYEKWGLGIFSGAPLSNVRRDYYFKNPGGLPEESIDSDHLLLSAEIIHSGKPYRVMTTHFTWTPQALNPSDAQKDHLEKLLALLREFPDFVLCGDFNTNRGGKLFDKIAGLYKDNIPPEYTSSIDGRLHRAGNLELMVDGLFTTPEYRAYNVSLAEGVSDHKAIVADIEKD